MLKSGVKSGCAAPLSASPDLMDVTRKSGGDGGERDEAITNGGEDGDEALTSARRTEVLHDPHRVQTLPFQKPGQNTPCGFGILAGLKNFVGLVS
ncbi:hypothetical protein [Asaia sp. HN010]|uniref:hypothetical protein n=1 Tax=Asaia sp. HN010 TaxID=3081233 RepID=UPI003018A753